MTKDVVNTYLRQSICLTAGMSLLALLFVNMKGDMEQLLMPICISAVFQLVACIAYGLVWKWVSSSSPASMPTLYMAASACRMFAAVVVVMDGASSASSAASASSETAVVVTDRSETSTFRSPLFIAMPMTMLSASSLAGLKAG